jgi:hypothetical protein
MLVMVMPPSHCTPEEAGHLQGSVLTSHPAVVSAALPDLPWRLKKLAQRLHCSGRVADGGIGKAGR